MSIKIANDTANGSVTLKGQNVAGDKTITMPNLDCELAPRMQLMTAQNSTSGTSIDFTGIPSWAKKITVMFNVVSTSGTSLVQFQLGAGSVQTTGYTSVGGITSGIGIQGSVSAGDSRNGNTTFTLLNGNTWQCSGGYVVNGNTFGATAGGVTLSGTLDRIRVTTVNGTDVFDAGQIGVLYEG